MSDQVDFKKKADTALSLLRRELSGAADDYGFQVAVSAGAISVDCGSATARFTISYNPATEQIVVQMPAKTYKMDWDIVEASFVHAESGQPLRELIEQTLSKHLREEITL
jgi:frataxin-like iron-binding protein CyaY